MGCNRFTEHGQSLLGGVKIENLRGKGKLGNDWGWEINAIVEEGLNNCYISLLCLVHYYINYY